LQKGGQKRGTKRKGIFPKVEETSQILGTAGNQEKRDAQRKVKAYLRKRKKKDYA